MQSYIGRKLRNKGSARAIKFAVSNSQFRECYICGHTCTMLNDLSSLSLASRVYVCAPAYYICIHIYICEEGFMYSRLITKPQLIVEAGSTRLHIAPETQKYIMSLIMTSNALQVLISTNRIIKMRTRSHQRMCLIQRFVIFARMRNISPIKPMIMKQVSLLLPHRVYSLDFYFLYIKYDICSDLINV